MATDQAQPKETNWTQTQRKYMLWVALPDELKDQRKLHEFAQAIGVSRVTLWKWRKLPGFHEQVQEYTKQYLSDAVPEVLTVLKDMARRGNFNHLKLYLEMVGMYTPKVAIDHTHIIKQEAQRVADALGVPVEEVIAEAERMLAEVA